MNKTDYVRQALASVGFTQPTDEVIDKIYADAERVTQIGVFSHPHLAVDAFVAVLCAYYPTSLEFIAAMRKLESQAGQSTSEFDELNERLNQMGSEEMIEVEE